MGLRIKSLIVHLSLFLATFVTVTLAGVQWLNKDPFELANLPYGLEYACLILLFLSAHEFGHYFAARAHNVDTTLPYFLPFPAFLGIAPFGTFGAVIKVKSGLNSRRALFDIGAAGPIAGFVVSVAMLVIGFRTLPAFEYLQTIHPQYITPDSIPHEGLAFGYSALYWLLEQLVPQANTFVPPMNEMYHYPLLCTGWFGLFVTALNLIPIGQLDGGHVVNALFDESANRIGQGALIILVTLGTLGVLPVFGIYIAVGWMGWLIWAIVLAVMMRSSRFRRPPLVDTEALTTNRRVLGWLCIAIFVVSFIPVPVTP